MRPDHPLFEVVLGDDPAAWDGAGFALDDDRFRVGATTFVCAGTVGGRGIRSVSIGAVTGRVEGITFTEPGRGAERRTHPNGVTGLDHLVVMTPNPDRTTAELESGGLDVRRVRRFGPDSAQTRQAFFWLGTTILELVGPDRATEQGPARAWGLAFTTPDIGATASWLGDNCGPVKPAVQPGRSIATLRSEALGISVPVAVMSPHCG